MSVEQHLLPFFIREENLDTPFVRNFLQEENLERIKTFLTNQLRATVRKADLPPVELSESLLSGLMEVAKRYHASDPRSVPYANNMFVENTIPVLETQFVQSVTWQRWCEQGIPDPLNIPLPIPAETTDFQVENNRAFEDPWAMTRPQW